MRKAGRRTPGRQAEGHEEGMQKDCRKAGRTTGGRQAEGQKGEKDRPVDRQDDKRESMRRT